MTDKSESTLLPVLTYHREHLWFFVVQGDDRLYLSKEFLKHALRWIEAATHYGPVLETPKPITYGPFRCSTVVAHVIEIALFTLANQSVQITVDRAWLSMMKPVLEEATRRIEIDPARSFKLGPGPDGTFREHPPDLHTLPPSAR